MIDKKTKILQSALKLFVEKGIDASATALIAKRAGVSNGTLFHYFQTKDVLIQALFHQVISERDEYCISKLDEAGNVKDKIRSLWESRIEWSMKNTNELLFLRQVFAQQSHQHSYKEVFAEKFIQSAELGIRQNHIGFMPVDFIFSLFEANINGMINYLLANPVKYRTPEFMRQSFEWYWNGLRNHAVQSVLN